MKSSCRNTQSVTSLYHTNWCLEHGTNSTVVPGLFTTTAAALAGRTYQTSDRASKWTQKLANPRRFTTPAGLSPLARDGMVKI